MKTLCKGLICQILYKFFKCLVAATRQYTNEETDEVVSYETFFLFCK